MNNRNTTTVRTGVNATVIAAIVWIIEQNTWWNIDTTDPMFIAGVGVVVTVGYRISLELVRVAPWSGRILFGISQAPSYTPTPLPPPPPPGV